MADWKDFLDPNAPPGRYLRWKEVERSTGLSRTTAWRLQRSGDFPRPYVISPGRVGYLEAEVDAWRTSRGHRGVESVTSGPHHAVAAPAEQPEAPPDNHPPPRPSPDRSGPALPLRPDPKPRLGKSRTAAAQIQMQMQLDL